MAIIAAYIDYLMNIEENGGTAPGAAPADSSSAINRWRSFGLQKGVLRI
jgi:acetyl-CoA carboxylase biotin carboxylase subunit